MALALEAEGKNKCGGPWRAYIRKTGENDFRKAAIGYNAEKAANTQLYNDCLTEGNKATDDAHIQVLPGNTAFGPKRAKVEAKHRQRLALARISALQDDAVHRADAIENLIQESRNLDMELGQTLALASQMDAAFLKQQREPSYMHYVKPK